MAVLDEELHGFLRGVGFRRFLILEERVSAAEGEGVVRDLELVGEVGEVVGEFSEGGAVGGGGGVDVEF